MILLLFKQTVKHRVKKLDKCNYRKNNEKTFYKTEVSFYYFK